MVGHGQARLAARTGARRPGVARWLVLALVLQAGLAAVDIFAADEVLFTTTFVLAPFALAVAGHARATAVAAIIAVALAVASGYWNDYAGSTDHLLRIAIVASGGILAVLAAWALERAAEQRARMSVLAAVGRLSGAEHVADAVDGLAGALVPAAADGCWIDLAEPDGTLRRLFEHGQSAPDPRSIARPELSEGGRRALVPLHGLGVLGLTSTGARYDGDDLAFFGIVAGRVALVLANARLVTDLRFTRARLDGILASLAAAVTVQDESGQTIYANAAAARLLGRDSPEDVTTALPGELAARFTITSEDGTPVAVDDLPGRRLVAGVQDPQMLTRTVDRVTGAAYWLLTKATPLQEGGRDYAVNIIEDVTDSKEAELRQRFLARAGQLLASSLDHGHTLEQLADLAVPWLADWCLIDLVDARGDVQPVALAPAGATRPEPRGRTPDARTALGRVLGGGPPELFADARFEEPEPLAALGLRSAMILPMRVGEETLGALTLATAESGRRFTEDDFAFAQDLALRAATSVQNVRLYQEQARVAHTLQASLLPDRLPVLPGWVSAASYQAGERGADVGGDFYDIVPAGGGRHLVFLGDVTGKGIAAAALTSLVRHSVRTAARFDPRPAAVLRLVNEILVEQPRLAPVTLVCALIDGSRVTLAAAGHPSPLLRRAGKVVPLGPTGILLGAVGDRTFREETVELRPGDTMLLYTDGVTDTPGAADRFGPERLAAILTAAPEEPNAVLADIEVALREFRAGSTVDDRAMLVLRFAGEPDAVAALRSVA